MRAFGEGLLAALICVAVATLVLWVGFGAFSDSTGMGKAELRFMIAAVSVMLAMAWRIYRLGRRIDSLDADLKRLRRPRDDHADR